MRLRLLPVWIAASVSLLFLSVLSVAAETGRVTVKETAIKKVNWQVGPLGTITPVAQIDPVQIGGSTVTYASLANFDLIKEKNINLSDIVSISRRGDVIPYIEKVVLKVKKGHLSAPNSCPSCKKPLKKIHKYLKCPNPHGP